MLRAEAAQGRVEPGSIVVELDVVEYAGTRLLARGDVFAVNRLVWLQLSMAALSWPLPRALMLAMSPCSSSSARCSCEQYWLSRSVCMMTPRGILRWSSTVHSASHTSDAGMRSLIDKQGRSVFEFLCASIGSRSGSSAARPSLLPSGRPDKRGQQALETVRLQAVARHDCGRHDHRGGAVGEELRPRRATRRCARPEKEARGTSA